MSAPLSSLASVPLFPTVDFRFRMEHGVEFRFTSVFMVALAYLAAVWGMKKAIKLRGKPFDLRGPLACWNFFLSAVSAYLLVWTVKCVWNDFHKIAGSSVWEMTCDYRTRLQFASHKAPLYAIFLTKYLELIDTAFLCLRGKPTPLIHVYHHAITVYFAWLHLVSGTCIAWMMSILNLSVHVLLYAYYGCAAMGYDIWWKRYLTLIQITQFVVTLFPSITVLGARILYTINPTIVGAYPCNGTWSSAFIGLCILLSYLFLFLNLYLTRFDATGADRKRKADAAKLKAKEEAAAMLKEQEMGRKFNEAENMKYGSVFQPSLLPSPSCQHPPASTFISPRAPIADTMQVQAQARRRRRLAEEQQRQQQQQHGLTLNTEVEEQESEESGVSA